MILAIMIVGSRRCWRGSLVDVDCTSGGLNAFLFGFRDLGNVTVHRVLHQLESTEVYRTISVVQ